MSSNRPSRSRSRSFYFDSSSASSSSASPRKVAPMEVNGDTPSPSRKQKKKKNKKSYDYKENVVLGWDTIYPNLVSSASMDSLSDTDMPLPTDLRAFCASGLGIFPREEKEEPPPLSTQPPPPLSSSPSSDSVPSSPLTQPNLDLATATNQLNTTTTNISPITNLTASSPHSMKTATTNSVDNITSDISNTIVTSRIENISTTASLPRYKPSRVQQRSKSDSELETDLQKQRKKSSTKSAEKMRPNSCFKPYDGSSDDEPEITKRSKKSDLKLDPKYSPNVKKEEKIVLRKRAKSMYVGNPDVNMNSGDIAKKKSPARRRSVCAKMLPDDPEDPFYLAPFQHGWKRELVQRNTDNNKRQRTEVFFISPFGKRLRTRDEISKLLPVGLNIEHFCFIPRLQGVGEPDETFRHIVPERRKSVNVAKQISKEDKIPMQQQKEGLKQKAQQVAKQEEKHQQQVKQQENPKQQQAKQTKQLKQQKTNNNLAQQQTLVSGKRVPKPKAPKGASPPPNGWTSTMAVLGNGRVLATKHNNSSSGAGSSGGNTARKRNSNANKSGKVASETTVGPPKLTVGPEPVVKEKTCSKCFQPIINDVNTTVSTDESLTHCCRRCLGKVVADENDNGVGQGIMQRIAEELERPGALPPAKLLRDDSPARPGGKITPKPMEVVVLNGRKAVAISDAPPRMHHLQLFSDESTLNIFAKFYSKRNATAKEKRQQVNDCISAGNKGCQLMTAIMKTLDMQERVRLSKVCKTWAMIGRDRSVWRTVKLRNTNITNWSLLLREMVRYCTVELDMMGGIIKNPRMLKGGDWGELKSLRILRTDAREAEIIESIIKGMPQLQEMRTTCTSPALNLANIEKMIGLRVLRIRMLDAKARILNELGLRGITNMDVLDLLQLKDLPHLETLVLGSCRGMEVISFGAEFLPSLKRLRRLRLENHHSSSSFIIKEIMDGIAAGGSVQRLELINVNIDAELSRQLSECKSLHELLLMPDFHNNSAYVVHYIMQAINENSEQLSVFCLGITNELLRVTRALAMIKDKDIIPVVLPIPGVPDNDTLNESECGIGYLPVDRLESILHHMMPQAWLTVSKVSQLETINMKFWPAPARKDKVGCFSRN